MNILITGMAGMLGSNIAFLLRNKHSVFGIDTNTVQIKHTTSFDVSAIDVEAVAQILVNNHIDVVIHCAALVNVDACEENPGYANAVNYAMTKNLHYLCKLHNIKMVFISTDAVYSGNKNGLNAEDDETAPISVYGKTKLEAENAVLRDSSALILRTNMYGFNYRPKNSFGEWVVQELSKEKTLNMFYDVMFSPILVNDLVRIIDLCLEKNISGLYNVGCQGSISKYDLGCLIQQEFGLPGVIRRASMHDFNFVAPRTENMGLDTCRIQSALSIVLPTPQENVKDFKRLYDAGYSKNLKLGV